MALADILEALGTTARGGLDGYYQYRALRDEEEDRKRKDTQFRLGMAQEGYSYQPQSKAERKTEKEFGIAPRTDRLGDYVRTGLSKDDAAALAEATKETAKTVERDRQRKDLVRMLGPVMGSEEKASGALALYDYAPGAAPAMISRMMPEREKATAPVLRSVPGVGLMNVSDPSNPMLVVPQQYRDRPPSASEERIGKQRFLDTVVAAYAGQNDLSKLDGRGATWTGIQEAMSARPDLYEQAVGHGTTREDWMAAMKRYAAGTGRTLQTPVRGTQDKSAGRSTVDQVVDNVIRQSGVLDSLKGGAGVGQVAAILKRQGHNQKMIDNVLARRTQPNFGLPD